MKVEAKRTDFPRYRPLSVDELSEWSANLERFGPKHDFSYKGDCETTEAIRNAYEQILRTRWETMIQ